MPKITRLPVQHPQAPHCAACKAPMPNFNDVSLVMSPGEGWDLLSITFHIQCKCGAKWNLQKKVKA